MARKRVIALGLAAAGGVATAAWWNATRTPEPGLRDPAAVAAAMKPKPPVHRPFAPSRSIAAAGCPLPETLGTPTLPAQTTVSGAMRPFRHTGGRLQPLAGFSVDARVLSTRTYDEDREAEFAPIDLALGWNRMRDDDVLASLDIGQQNRWYYTRWDAAPPIPITQVRLESANMHMIPASREVAAALAAIRRDQRVRIDGWLVEVQANDGWRWRSSLTREDSGQGGCEVVYVCGVAVE